MFKATRPFNDKLTTHPKEPSLRIGRCVPKDAVNLAYYYNPTATDAEKILTAEAPRNTIDHRVEEAYRYLFNQSSDDDDLFPSTVWYEDEENYQGNLHRMYVLWYPKSHVKTKNVTQTKTELVLDKSDLTKMIEYTDLDGYTGNLYLDASDFVVTKEKDVSTIEIVDREVVDHELNYNEITGTYLSPSSIDAWMKEPSITGDTYWPFEITVGPLKTSATGGQTQIKSFINNTNNPYDGALGVLQFDYLEYEMVDGTPATSGTIGSIKSISSKFSNKKDASQSMTLTKARQTFKNTYLAVYDPSTGYFDYSQINDFITMAQTYCTNTSASFFTTLQNAMTANKDIAVFIDKISLKAKNPSSSNTKFYAECYYKYRCSSLPHEGTYKFNVVANYKGVLKKTILTTKKIPYEWKATNQYVGIVRKVWNTYDGMAYYRGAVTKGNSVGNMNPEDDNELLMFSDDQGYLRRQVIKVEEDGSTTIKNFYRVESDYIYLTDVFKNGVACFYKYPLKKPIYDYRGPDDNGFYEGNAVKIFTSNLKDIPEEYEHNMKLVVDELETVDTISEDKKLVTKTVPKRYKASLYTSFISSSTDTFKVVYNAFNDSISDNIAIDNGEIEEIYNYPFMHKDTDFYLETVDKKARINKIKLPEPRFIVDTRRYITFSYVIIAERKPVWEKIDGEMVKVKDGASYTTSPITASILNKDYVVKEEYNKFEGRGMIVSPKVQGIYLSPMDIVLQDQAASSDEVIITSKDTDFIFYINICSSVVYSYDEESFSTDFIISESVNIKCNPDGSGLITAETTADTGFFDEKHGTYTKKLCLDSPYIVEDGKIYPGFKVKCVDSRYIKVNAPREQHLLQSWYPMIQFGHFSQILDQYGTHTKVCYSMPEYDTQHFSTIYGKPYVDVFEEKVEILNSHMVKTKCYPLHVLDMSDSGIYPTIKLFKRVGTEDFIINISNISFSDGVIITRDTISENDNILCTYTYHEENFIYRGFWRNLMDFCRIDLNPNKYHTYSDMSYTPSETKPSKNLFNKVIYFFMKPTVEYEVSAENDSLIFNPEDETPIGTTILSNDSTLYHKIDDAQPSNNKDIAIGSVYIRQDTSLHSTVLIDSRTRGGGVSESIKDSLRKQLEPESDFYLDIGYYDGEPYQENGVIIVRLDNSLLKEFGGKFTQGDIEQKVKRWLGFGVYPIIEYVDSYSKKDMPQYSLEVEDSYTNVLDITPEFILECVDI